MSMNFLGGMQGEEHASGGVARRRNGEPAGEPAFDPGAASPGGGGEERPFVPGSLKQDLKRLQDRIPAHQVQLVCLVIITACLVVGALHWLRPVLVPLIIALVLKNMLAPIVDVLVRRLQFPKVLAVLAAISVGIGVLVLLGSVAASSVRELTRKDNMRLYKEAAEALVRKTTHVFDKLSDTHQGLADMGKEQFGDLPVGETVVKMTNSLVQEVIGLAELAFLVLVFSIYMLQGYDPYAPARRGAVGKVETRLKKYLIIKTLVSAMLGMLVGLLLLTLNVPLVGIFNFANFALNFIPNIGPTVATMMPIPLMLFSGKHGGFSIFLACVIPTGLHLLVGGIIEPQLMGDQLELHPITVLLGLIFWGALWGMPGMFMSAPLTAGFKVVFESIEVTRPFARLLAGHLDSGGGEHFEDL